MTDYRKNDLFQRIATEMEIHPETDSTGHDIHHAWRVLNVGAHIAELEGADTEIVGAAALTHDLHRVRATDGFIHPRETLDEVHEILVAADVPQSKTEAVLHCVEVHEEYDFEEEPDATETLEAEIVQDADNLDAIGAIGIARTFAFGGTHGNALWNPETDDTPIGPYEKQGGGDTGSTMRHIHEKLLRLKETMNTDAGRALAEERHACERRSSNASNGSGAARASRSESAARAYR